MTPQNRWKNIIDESAYTYAAIIRDFKLCQSSFNNWIHVKVTAREKSLQRMEAILKTVIGG